MKNFARLEEYDGMQVLSYVDTVEDEEGSGPALITMCNPNVCVKITEGPYDDTEAGWDAIETLLKEKDLEAFQKGAVELTVRFAK